MIAGWEEKSIPSTLRTSDSQIEKWEGVKEAREEVKLTWRVLTLSSFSGKKE